MYETLSASQGPIGTFLFRKPLIAVTGNFSATSLAVSDDGGLVYRLPLISEVSWKMITVHKSGSVGSTGCKMESILRLGSQIILSSNHVGK